MKASDRGIILGIGIVVLIAGFWFLLLSPQRDRAAELSERNDELRAQIAEQEQVAAYGEQARDRYDQNFRRVVTLGKAAPESSDSGSLMVQLSGLARGPKIEFMSLALKSDGAAAPPPTLPPAATPGAEAPAEVPAEGEAEGEGGGGLTEVDVGPSLPATEAAAATLPIGATVGPAGLPVMPYELSFIANFNRFADFLGEMDSSVSVKNGKVRVSGRLTTIDGFTLARDPQLPYPVLKGDLAITTYVTPATEGLTAGATATGPLPVSDQSGALAP